MYYDHLFGDKHQRFFTASDAFSILNLMIATIINCITVIIGSFIGLFLHKKLNAEIKTVVFVSAGLISVVIGMKMAFESQRILYVILSLFAGGILGSIWRIEDHILTLGIFLERHFTPAGRSRNREGVREKSQAGSEGKTSASTSGAGTGKSFARGFLNASVLFCVGAMTIVGAIKAGAEGDYDLILMKSVMDGFMADFSSALISASTISCCTPITKTCCSPSFSAIFCHEMYSSSSGTGISFLAALRTTSSLEASLVLGSESTLNAERKPVRLIMIFFLGIFICWNSASMDWLKASD